MLTLVESFPAYVAAYKLESSYDVPDIRSSQRCVKNLLLSAEFLLSWQSTALSSYQNLRYPSGENGFIWTKM